ncbi:translation initiation factor [Lujinxingia litoralis]|uniref:Translation initiation factor n=1 Tax=Lujinxingia litoralis TaxID=2211119 RepID=A0A328C8R7_9DELT|nr:translation initiation factor [Lujinxingia litoralis]RAL23004.1 translation initiation factor [Lujinxingia litoralis]
MGKRRNASDQRNASKKKIALDADTKGFGHNPFAAHFGQASSPAAPPEETSTAPNPQHQPAPGATLNLARLKHLRLRIERKGRGGKTVTLLEGLGSPGEDALEALLGQLKRALGCGAAIDGEAIALQGDQRERAARWLQEQGASVR